MQGAVGRVFCMGIREVECIVVGGGPAGSTAAWELKRQGRDVLVLDALEFPRSKLCAGWLTPKVLEDLELTHSSVPSLEVIPTFKLHWRHWHPNIEVPAGQYSVQRHLFDTFLLERSDAPVEVHRVQSIQRTDEGFLVDGKFACRFLIGAGGTHCPVKRQIFPSLHANDSVALARELEFKPYGPVRRESRLLWRMPYDPGFAWFVPKPDAVNIGFGYFKHSRALTKEPWAYFVDHLKSLGLLSREDNPKPKGWGYYLLRDPRITVKDQGAYLIGDAAGLATEDLGEGIGPAVESGRLSARDILGLEDYGLERVTRHSMYGGRYLGRLLSPLFDNSGGSILKGLGIGKA